MTSYLLSQLAKSARELDFAAFVKRFDHDWIIWEPGPWRPPQKSAGTLVLAPAPLVVEKTPGPAGKPPSGEALALGLRLPKGKDVLALGRSPDCELAISDATVSARHLALTHGEGSWTVRDTGSSNGSWLEGSKLEAGVPRRLLEGAQLRAGSVYLTYHQPGGLYLRLRTGG